MEENMLKVTSIEDLKRISEGELVQLPNFSENVPFVARLKRPSMLALIKTGKIPNELLDEANGLFTNGVSKTINSSLDKEVMIKMFDLFETICEESLVEPSYRSLKEAGITLTDEQQMAIFSYTQSGVRALKPFRQEW
jgi:hypothetical protein